MSYNIIDLINKALGISKRIKDEYNMIVQKNKENLKVKILSLTLVKMEEEKSDKYNILKNECKLKVLNEIPFNIYDKVSSLIAQFTKKLIIKDIKNVNDLISYAIKVNEDTRALFVDVRGRLVQKESDGDSYEFQILTKIIKLQKKCVIELKDLKNFKI